ncbi:purine catabolism regulatory protein [Quadrisphaera granulorum]|uniref:Purine catabolism regulator n=1 Tax=Quadrisphaera granulorum TaxID=317664 RepID=A0A316A6P5_9ACTN|nr:PucR family transcriptional regulator [Quadrisphaera granulorum]PWJ53606.1 purine catabolism regulator [Quadrisphaera granulorum]SZE96650.1 purine catabolism regulatory protein [Quadrisphaera granulorum]
MALLVREALQHPVVSAASPQVLTDGADLDVPVRWVHSSEIYEIGPLLTGGELLLTTGLGVSGADAGARRHYVRDLAARGVAALAIEVGRSLPAVPPEMVDEATRRGLPLVVLREVVPFIRISEALNTLIVDDTSARLRLSERVTAAVQAAQAEERGLAGLLAAVGQLLGRPLVLVSAGGALVSAAGTPDDRAAWRVVESPAAVQVDVVVRGRRWGAVAAGSPSGVGAGGSGAAGGAGDVAVQISDDDVSAALSRLAPALALELLHGRGTPHRPDQLAARLLADLVEGESPDTDLLVRAGAAGFHPGAADVVVGVAVDVPESRTGLSLLQAAARSTGSGGTVLRGRVGADVLALFALDRPDPVRVVAEALTAAWRRAGEPPLQAAVGDAVAADRGAAGWRWTLGRARAAASLASRAPAPPEAAGRVTTARAWALELLLHENGAPVADIADSTLRGLRRWDARHGSDLVRTVETHLRFGGSPSRTAEELQIGRQAVYQRLARIEELLGHPLDAPDAHAALLVAAAAARLARTPSP